MRKRFDLGTFGAPSGEHRHHRIRELGALVAAVSGGTAVLVAGFLFLGGHHALTAVGAWVFLALLVTTWLTGLWWRWDSPDRREKGNERERRGF
jgi:hypothetical protein